MRILMLAACAAVALAQRAPLKPEDVAAGRQLYMNSCAGCHGLTGEGGRGPNPMGGRAVSRSSDEALFQSLKFGLAGTDMPPTKLPDEKLWQISGLRPAAFRPRPTKSPSRATRNAGAAIYFGKGGCTRCHAVSPAAAGSAGRTSPASATSGP
jgi:mono/diheme cytochrome c family protein